MASISKAEETESNAGYAKETQKAAPTASCAKINISIKKLADPEPLLLEIEPNDTVAAVKDLIHEASGVAPLKQTLVFCKKKLGEDEASMESCGVTEGASLLLLVMPEDAIIEELRRCIAAMKDVKTYAGDNIAEAAAKGAWHDVVRLLDAGADTGALDTGADTTTGYGYSALMSLAGCPHADKNGMDPFPATLLMRWLLMQGADPNLPDNSGKVPLHAWGKYGGSLAQGKVLLEFGADVNHLMEGLDGYYAGRGYSPLWYVRYYKHPQAPTDSQAKESGATCVGYEPEVVDTDKGPLWEQAAAILVEAGAVEKP